MINSKTLVLGSLMAGMSVVFQLIPVLFSELFVLLTIFSALPIYIVSRTSPKAGILAYATAGLLISMLSVHEGIFFLFANGPVGVSLGTGHHFIDNRWLISAVSAVILTYTLSLITFVLGIPVFGVPMPFNFWACLILLFGFALFYCSIFLRFANKLYLLVQNLMN